MDITNMSREELYALRDDITEELTKREMEEADIIWEEVVNAITKFCEHQSIEVVNSEGCQIFIDIDSQFGKTGIIGE